MSNIQDLIREWSVFAMMAGVIGAFLSHRVTKKGYTGLHTGGEWLVVYGLPWSMALLSIFFAWLIPASAAFSGTLERWAWHEVGRYDVRLAFFITFTFGFGFALDALRVKSEKAKTSICGNLLGYLVAGGIVFCVNFFKGSN